MKNESNPPRWARKPVDNPAETEGGAEEHGHGQRLHKVLAASGVASRRIAEEMIAAGRITVNGEVVREMGVKVDIATDTIAVDGRPLKAANEGGQIGKLVYIALNKPLNVVSTVRDPFNRPTVLSILHGARLHEQGVRLFPVGRLDADSTGLVLLTNDGDLTFRLTHPRFGVEKEYRVLLRGRPGEDILNRLREGVEIEGGKTAPAKVDFLSHREGNSWLRITIHEGRKRQVRLMAAAVGYPVIELQRTRVGPIELGALELGTWRNLAVHEVHALRKAVKLKPNDYKGGTMQPQAPQAGPVRPPTRPRPATPRADRASTRPSPQEAPPTERATPAASPPRPGPPARRPVQGRPPRDPRPQGARPFQARPAGAGFRTRPAQQGERPFAARGEGTRPPARRPGPPRPSSGDAPSRPVRSFGPPRPERPAGGGPRPFRPAGSPQGPRPSRPIGSGGPQGPRPAGSFRPGRPPLRRPDDGQGARPSGGRPTTGRPHGRPRPAGSTRPGGNRPRKPGGGTFMGRKRRDE